MLQILDFKFTKPTNRVVWVPPQLFWEVPQAASERGWDGGLAGCDCAPQQDTATHPKASEIGELDWLLAWQQKKKKRDHWTLFVVHHPFFPSSRPGKIGTQGVDQLVLIIRTRDSSTHFILNVPRSGLTLSEVDTTLVDDVLKCITGKGEWIFRSLSPDVSVNHPPA